MSDVFRKLYESQKVHRKVINKVIFSDKIKNKLLGFPSKKEIVSQLDFLIHNQYKGQKFFLFPSPSSPWGYMFQRPHQLAKAISKKGFLVLYSVNTDFPEEPDWNTRGLQHIEDNIYLINDGCEGKTLAAFADKLIIWQYWPHQFKNIEQIANNKTTRIFDCIDHISTFNPYKSITKDFSLSLERADIVLATSSSIYKDIKKVRPDCLLVPNAVCIEDFDLKLDFILSDDDMSIYNDIHSLSENGFPVIGYYGAIAEWMDFNLIQKISQLNKSFEFVFIGEKYPNIKLPKANNLHFFKRVSYEAIIKIGRLFDVAILPFKINDITINTSPVKIFEYMAANKPIVSTPLPEVFNYKSVIVADGSEMFSDALRYAVKLKNDTNYLSLLKFDAEENTWTSRVNEVLKELSLL